MYGTNISLYPALCALNEGRITDNYYSLLIVSTYCAASKRSRASREPAPLQVWSRHQAKAPHQTRENTSASPFLCFYFTTYIFHSKNWIWIKTSQRTVQMFKNPWNNKFTIFFSNVFGVRKRGGLTWKRKRLNKETWSLTDLATWSPVARIGSPKITGAQQHSASLPWRNVPWSSQEPCEPLASTE